jgi:hypothetical protein
MTTPDVSTPTNKNRESCRTVTWIYMQTVLFHSQQPCAGHTVFFFAHCFHCHQPTPRALLSMFPVLFRVFMCCAVLCCAVLVDAGWGCSSGCSSSNGCRGWRT